MLGQKQGKMEIQTGQPLRFIPAEQSMAKDDSKSSISRALLSTFAAYSKSAENLLHGKFKDLRSLAPIHLQQRGSTTIFRCLDGIFVRHDRPSDEIAVIRYCESDKSIAEIAPIFSDQLLHFPEDPKTFHAPSTGPEIKLQKYDASGGSQDIVMFRPLILASMHLPEGFKLPPPPARPPAVISIQSEFEMQIVGEIVPSEDAPNRAVADIQQFVARGQLKLELGWQAIEIYPLLGEEYWRAEYAPMWAELDILAAVATKNLVSSSFSALDGRGAARKKYAALLQEMEELLSGPEEPVHQFIKLHPELISPTHEFQWSKLPFGNHVSDFVFREQSNDYLLVEIEAPYRELFRKDGQQRQELTHAIDQISDWMQYICDNKAKIETELGLVGISTTPRTLVVIGRSSSLSDENRRKLTTLESRQPRLRILTYDDLIANAKANLEHILGSLSLIGQNAELYYF